MAAATRHALCSPKVITLSQLCLSTYKRARHGSLPHQCVIMAAKYRVLVLRPASVLRHSRKNEQSLRRNFRGYVTLSNDWHLGLPSHLKRALTGPTR